MHKSKLIITILISVVALVLLEGIVKSIITANSAPNTSPFNLMNFIPSFISAFIVSVPIALQNKPKSFNLFIPIGTIWFITAFFGTTLLSSFGEKYHFLALVHFLGPKISAISLMLLIAYIVDNDLINKNET